MKNLKKIASLALALIMALAMMAPALAADEGSIIIDNAFPEEIYSVYKILDLESYTTNGAQSYKIADGWTDFFATGAGAGTLEGLGTDKTDLSGYVNWIGPETNSTRLADLAKAALEYAKTNNISANDTKSSPALSGGSTETAVTVEFTGLDLGWYLLDSSVGVLCSLDVTDPDATIKEKNETTAPHKTQDTTAVVKGVGDIITYTVEVPVKPGATNYILHDTMSEGLTYNHDVSAKVKDTDATTVSLEDMSSSYLETTFASKIVNVEEYVGQTIVFTYTATINEKAVVKDEVTNTAKVSYGDNNKFTEETSIKYYLYDLEVFKYTNDENGTKVQLEGAEFELYDAQSGGNKLNLVKETIGEKTVYRIATAEEAAKEGFESAVIVAGKVTIKGLAAGTYWLEETKAPEGYNKLTARDKAEVSENSSGGTAVYTTEVLNQTGAQLPSTGGIGTTIFYLIGGFLVAGAAILLVTRKRVREQ